MAKITINDTCIACGTCEAMCPQVFKIVNGKSTVISEDCSQCNCQEVAESCPVNAIVIEEEK